MPGITAFATYLPGGSETSADLAVATGIPQTVIEEKFGLVSKPRAAQNEQVSQMAVCAARRCLGQIPSFNPESIGAVLWTGSEYKDFALWTAAIKVQHEFGATRAWGIDLAARCASTQAALKIAADMITADPSINTVLLAGGHRMIEKLDYTNERARFLFTMSDAASAVPVQRGGRHKILKTAMYSDGAFSEDVVIPGGGTRMPLTRENFDPRLLKLDVPDPQGMKQRLDPGSIPNFLRVIREAAAGHPIDYLAIIHLKPSVHCLLLRELGLRDDQSIHLNTLGHAGAPDVILSMELARPRLRKGDHIVLAGAGTGYLWAATALQWGGQ
jgi:3-oxoacyl-[acyl-carrier-protein] synthase III